MRRTGDTRQINMLHQLQFSMMNKEQRRENMLPLCETAANICSAAVLVVKQPQFCDEKMLTVHPNTQQMISFEVKGGEEHLLELEREVNEAPASYFVEKRLTRFAKVADQ